MKKLFLFIMLICIIKINGQTPFFIKSQLVGKSISRDSVISNLPLDTISGFGLGGSITLNSDTSWVRIILKSINGTQEFLVLETYRKIADSTYFRFSNECFESCFLDSFIPGDLEIQEHDASVFIDSIKWTDLSVINALELQTLKKIQIDSLRILKLNTYLSAHDFIWRADQTNLSLYFYYEKKKIFGNNFTPIGYEYFSKGIFSTCLPNSGGAVKHYGFVDNFDWRNRHGVNWLTPVRQQNGCWDGSTLNYINENQCYAPNTWRQPGACWIFGAVGSVESVTNLFFNQHLDLDLSEQEIGCSDPDKFLNGDKIINSTTYIKENGISDEQFKIYTASPNECQAGNENERIHVENYKTLTAANVNNMLKDLIMKGPMAAGDEQEGTLMSGHAMTLVGWDVIDEDDIVEGITTAIPSAWYGFTYFIYKDSFGPQNDINGFRYIVPWGYDGVHFPIVRPIDVSSPTSITSDYNNYQVKCEDKDQDGYYFWGVGPKPSTCPFCPDQEDGDDSNPALGPPDENGFCSIIDTYTADFEKTFDNWKQEKIDNGTSSELDFWRHKGPTVASGPNQGDWTGPLAAQHGDYYIYIDADLDPLFATNPFRKNATITSPPINLSPDYCYMKVKFHYHMHTMPCEDPEPGLGLFIPTVNGAWKNVWCRMGDQGTDWHEVTLYLPTSDRFRFVASSGNTVYSHMALDNITIGPPIPEDSIISQNASVSGTKKVFNNIIIEQGITFTVTGTLLMSKDTKIIVKQGGKLVVDNGTIRALCPSAFWSGIQVCGNKNLYQSEENQGKVYLWYATIQNAYNAIALWGPNYNNTGGIVQATGTFFIDNRRAAEFISYHNYYPPNHKQISNISYFKNCHFQTTLNYTYNKPFYSFITMWDVEGVKVQGCTFENSQVFTSNPARGMGIYTENASVSVENYHRSVTENIQSSFTGLLYGICSIGCDQNHTASVQNAFFSNNSYGIALNSVNNPFLINNSFKLGNNTNCPNYTGIGIDLSGCNSYTVEQNDFSPLTGLVQSNLIGIRINNPSINAVVEYNQVYKNTFAAGINVGNEADGKNINAFKDGLHYICNTHAENNYDIFIYSINYGIAQNQGNSTLAAGNIFSSTNYTWNILNNSSSSIFYYWNGVGKITPTVPNNSGVTNIQAQNSNSCPDHYPRGGDGGIDPWSITTTQEGILKDSFNGNDSQYRLKKTNYLSLLDGGNTNDLINWITTCGSKDTTELLSYLNRISPFVSEQAIQALINRYDLIDNATTDAMIRSNPDLVRDETILESLKTIRNFTDSQINSLRSYTSIISSRTTLLNEIGDVNQARSVEASKIINSYIHDSVANPLLLREWYIKLGGWNNDLAVIDSYLSTGDADSAMLYLNNLPNKYTFTEQESQEYSYIYGLKSLQSDLVSQGLTIFDVDSVQKAFISNIGAASQGMAAVQAQNWITIINGGDPQILCGPTPMAPKMTENNTTLTTSSDLVSVKVIPNPSSGMVNISITLGQTDERCKFDITDVNGKVLKTENIDQKSVDLIWNAEEYTNGIYFYHLYLNNSSKSGKIIIRK